MVIRSQAQNRTEECGEWMGCRADDAVKQPRSSSGQLLGQLSMAVWVRFVRRQGVQMELDR